MNKKVLAVALFTLSLAGCQGANASIQNGNDAIMTIGDKTYTKQDEYELIKKANGGVLTVQLAKNVVYDKTVGVTDEIKKDAQKSYDDLKNDYDDLDDQLKQMGYADKDDYIETVLIPEQQGLKLQKQYFTDNKDAIKKEYKPSLITVLKCDDEKTAQKAIDALKDGQDLASVYEAYTSADSTYSNSEIVCTTLDTTLPTRAINEAYKAKKEGVIDEVFTNDDGTTYAYVIIVSSNDYDKNIDAYESTISAGDSFESEIWTYYFTKYDLQIHDQDIFDYLKVNNPEYLIDYPELSESDED
ncbi:hypothetical protein [Floccifex sp.]|uniref:hypothetical protein n=1 Tax=Floccifex sp. TaxID=2815810 RepID=UPI002A7504C6|nr:hypothetical protein [Floccifex sp.]MDD7280864.1 hypothetical protein [Erysipelotrichaceae bacterium]MDY2958328.1 hypothetical protein [Floccifex sp.]